MKLQLGNRGKTAHISSKKDKEITDLTSCVLEAIMLYLSNSVWCLLIQGELDSLVIKSTKFLSSTSLFFWQQVVD